MKDFLNGTLFYLDNSLTQYDYLIKKIQLNVRKIVLRYPYQLPLS